MRDHHDHNTIMADNNVITDFNYVSSVCACLLASPCVCVFRGCVRSLPANKRLEQNSSRKREKVQTIHPSKHTHTPEMYKIVILRIHTHTHTHTNQRHLTPQPTPPCLSLSLRPSMSATLIIVSVHTKTIIRLS